MADSRTATMEQDGVTMPTWCDVRGRCLNGGPDEHHGCHGHNARTGAPCRSGWGCPHHGAPPWTSLMESFGQLWNTIHQRITALVASMEEDELRDLLAATHALNDSNCWWAAYEIREEVRDQARQALWWKGRRITSALLVLAGLDSGRGDS